MCYLDHDGEAVLLAHLPLGQDVLAVAVEVVHLAVEGRVVGVTPGRADSGAFVGGTRPEAVLALTGQSTIVVAFLHSVLWHVNKCYLKTTGRM